MYFAAAIHDYETSRSLPAATTHEFPRSILKANVLRKPSLLTSLQLHWQQVFNIVFLGCTIPIVSSLDHEGD